MTNQPPVRGLHLVRYGTAADQKFLLTPFLGTYDQIVINANMVAHMPAALASFLLQRAKNKPYFIDPQTHAFQHDVSNLESTGTKSAGQIKKSIRVLLESYGEPVRHAVLDEERSVLPSDFSNGDALEGFCERVVRFQVERISAEATKSDSAKYYNYLVGKKGSVRKTGFEPTLAVAPYFFMTPRTFRQWLDPNVRALRHCLDMASPVPIAAQIVISSDLLVSAKLRGELLQAYTKLAPAAFLVWIDSFSEHDASEEGLRAFVALLQALGNVAPVVNLYGGFFSVALRHCRIVKGLAGVAHGLEYGESRPVVPVGGGIPIAKFYYPAMHKRLPFREALRAVRKEGGMQSVSRFYDRVCDCDECKAVIRDDPNIDFAAYGRTRPISFMRKDQPVALEYPLPETKTHSVRHYMWCKRREYRAATSPSDIMADLERTQALGGTLGLGSVAYAYVWQDVLNDAMQN